MPEINIEVRNKIAEKTDDMIYVCNNSDYIASFDFDSEWDAYNTKTARFSHDGQHVDVVFTGNQCNVPVITNTYAFHVGVFAGDLHTTTAARVPCRKSILCGAGAPANPTPDVYDQLMELIKGLGGADPDAIAKAVADYLAAHPIEETDPTVPEWAKADTKPTYTAAEVGAISQSDLQASTDAALAQAKSSGEFDGAPGPAGPQGPAGAPGKDGAGMDITGASVGQIAKIAAVDASGVPTAWSPVDMPSGGGDPRWIEVVDITTEEQTRMLTISVDKDGRPISQYNALGMIFTIFFRLMQRKLQITDRLGFIRFPKQAIPLIATLTISVRGKQLTAHVLLRGRACRAYDGRLRGMGKRPLIRTAIQIFYRVCACI